MTNIIHSLTNQKSDKILHPDRLLRWNQVQPIVGICRSHCHQLVARNLFPKPRKIVPGGRASAWVEREIQEWVQQRITGAQPDSSDKA